MKYIIGAILILGLFLYITKEDGYEKVKASGRVVAKKAEMTVVDIAGKSEVTLELAETRIDTLRKRLIAIKSTKRSLLKKAENPDLPASTKENYANLLVSLSECEKKGEDALKSSKDRLEELRIKLEIMDTEISIAKTSTSLINDTNPTSGKDEIKQLVESLEKDLDDANAELDVAIIEAQ